MDDSNVQFWNWGTSKGDAAKYYGRKILSAEMKDDHLCLGLDGATIHIYDDADLCCEHRYMTTDDKVESLVGGKLVRIDPKPGVGHDSDENPGEQTHETMFVEIGTDKGFITLVNHNEHNGYYGGFILRVTEILPPQQNDDRTDDSPESKG